MIQRVRAAAPCRVDLSGGTLDIWPLGLLHPGACTVNVAVDLPMEVELRPGGRSYRVALGDVVVEAESLAELSRNPATALVAMVAGYYELPPAEIAVRSSSPLGAGLGASSALAIALIAACEEATGVERSGTRASVQLARDLEAQLMGLPTGIQDHYPAVVGGALRIDHLAGGECVTSLDVDLECLGRHLRLVFTGQSHVSARNNWEIVRRRLDGEEEMCEVLGSIARLAQQMADSLVAGDPEQVGKLMSEEWQLRRRLSPVASTPVIENLLEVAVASGAWGGRACGAGGGGCVAVICPESAAEAVERHLGAAGGTLLRAVPTSTGLRVESG